MLVTKASSKSHFFELPHEKGERCAGREIEVKLSYLIEKAGLTGYIGVRIVMSSNQDIMLLLSEIQPPKSNLSGTAKFLCS
jgi:hypothetical protein